MKVSMNNYLDPQPNNDCKKNETLKYQNSLNITPITNRYIANDDKKSFMLMKDELTLQQNTKKRDNLLEIANSFLNSPLMQQLAYSENTSIVSNDNLG